MDFENKQNQIEYFIETHRVTLNLSSANLTKWLNTLKQFVGKRRGIV